MTAGTKKSKQQTKPIYVIAGKDKFLVDGSCHKLLDELLTPDQRAMALFNADPEKTAIVDIFDELRTMPFLADRRVVVIKDADDFVSQYRQQLEKYFDNPSPCGVLILTVRTWPKTTRLARKLTTAGTLITAAELKPWQLPRYIMDYTRTEHGKTISKPAAEMLVELVGDDPAALASEVEKLAVYTDPQKQITPDHIEALIGHNRLFNAFAVIDAMTAGKRADGIGRLRKMFAADKNAPYTIVGAFAWQLRRLFRARALLDKGNSTDQIASKLKIWRDKDGFFRQINRMSLVQIASAIQQLAHIDHAVKTGRQQIEIAIEQLVLKLAEHAN